jgi:hypothetical protein
MAEHICSHYFALLFCWEQPLPIVCAASFVMPLCVCVCVANRLSVCLPRVCGDSNTCTGINRRGLSLGRRRPETKGCARVGGKTPAGAASSNSALPRSTRSHRHTGDQAAIRLMCCAFAQRDVQRLNWVRRDFSGLGKRAEEIAVL